MKLHRGLWLGATACLALGIGTAGATAVSDPPAPPAVPSVQASEPVIHLAQQISVPTGRKISSSKTASTTSDSINDGTVAGGGGGSGSGGGGGGGGW